MYKEIPLQFVMKSLKSIVTYSQISNLYRCNEKGGHQEKRRYRRSYGEESLGKTEDDTEETSCAEKNTDSKCFGVHMKETIRRTVTFVLVMKNTIVLEK